MFSKFSYSSRWKKKTASLFELFALLSYRHKSNVKYVKRVEDYTCVCFMKVESSG